MDEAPLITVGSQHVAFMKLSSSRARSSAHRSWIVALTLSASALAASSQDVRTEQIEPVPSYRLAPLGANGSGLDRFTEVQLQLLEKLNRSDRGHLSRLESLIVPDGWDLAELAHAPLPKRYAWAELHPKALIIHQPLQVFGAYEHGQLVRWGPVSSGRREFPTPPGLFHLNWRSRGRHSTDDPDWYMEWYFNFNNRRGISIHAYALPGYPASHACVRVLPRDAQWLFSWGEEWQLAPGGRVVLQRGTPVLIVGVYDFDQPPPWQSSQWLGRMIELPDGPILTLP